MKFVPNKVSSTVGRQMLKLDKVSPQVLFGAGIVGFGATVVLACRATLELDNVLEDIQRDLNTVETVTAAKPEKYSERDAVQAKGAVYIKGSLKIAKLYGPALAVGAVSIGCLTQSHNILNRRNAALTAAYAAVEKGFKEYRERVVAELGEEKDQEFRYGVVEKTVIDESDGKGAKKVQVKTADPNGISIYARFFDQVNCGGNWSPNPEYNRVFLTNMQNWANDLLISRGHIFLNEVYDMLGMERTKAGSVVGWIVSDEGDNYVDFGIFNGNREAVREFVNGHEGAILLDFNVDGVIYDKI